MVQFLDIHEPGQTPLPHEQKSPAIGIDLGTTHSLVAVVKEGIPQVIKDKEGHAIHPSVVAYEEDGAIITGKEAHQKKGAIRSIKRLMGKAAEEVQTVAGHLPYDVVVAEEKSAGMVRLKVSGKTVTPVEISAEILKSLKQQAEEYLEAPVQKAVITVPAYFDDAARSATKDAAKLAGLEVLRLVNEPTAAALAYGLDKGAEGLYAVYDLGGGTFDISLLKMQKGVFQVLATGGDTSLGGDDFDREIVEWLIADQPLSLTTEGVLELLQIARETKEALTEEDAYDIACEVQGVQLQKTLKRSTFEELIWHYVAKTCLLAEQVLEDAGVAKEAIQGVILVGGSTRIPLVRSEVEKCFGSKPLTDVHPDEVVALGAAVQAAGLTVGSNHLLLDVIPLSLGIEMMGGIVEKIIERNTPIPVATAQEFTTYQDGQTGMSFHIVQGEREMAKDCRSLAHFTLKGIPPLKAGVAKVKVTFTVDADGLLTVSAQEETTGSTQEIAVKPSYGLREDEIESMLRDSMKHAREDVTLRLLTEAKVEASRNMLAVEEALKVDGKLLDNEARSAIEHQLQSLKNALASENREAILEQMQLLETAIGPLIEKQMDVHVAEHLKGLDINALEKKIS